MTPTVESLRPGPLRPVRRVHVDALTAAEREHLFTGETPLIVEGLDRDWPESLRGGGLRDFAVFARRVNSVFIDGKQTFGLGGEDFLKRAEAGENVRVFGVRLAPEITEGCAKPDWLFEQYHAEGLYRYKDPKPSCFLGAGHAVTPLHYDFEENVNWHMALVGARRVFLWTRDQSPNLFKLPIIGLSPIPFARGLLPLRFAEGHIAEMRAGDLLFMPPACWHQIEYDGASAAMTYGLHATAAEQAHGIATGDFWRGFMSFAQGLGKLRWRALAGLPLMLPLAAFMWVYVLGNFLAARLGAPGRAVIRALEAADRGMLKLYAPLMAYFRRTLWVGH